ncbi:MAG TPA: peptide ABC transporter substrate-binding protein, partial [Ktedonobacterales bacterium]
MSDPHASPQTLAATAPHSPAPQRPRILALIVTLVGLAAIVGAGVFITRGGGPRPAVPGPCNGCPDEQVLHVAWVGNGTQVSALDPSIASDTTNLPIVSLLYDTLMTTDQRLTPRLWGADQVSVSADGRTYSFHIRAGQVFSDGMPVYASDYAYGITRALDPCLQSPMNYVLWMIQGAERFSDPKNCVHHAAAQPLTAVVADDGAATLTITLQQPAAYFLAALTTPVDAALERGAVAGPDQGKDEHWTAGLVATGAHPTGQGGSGMYYVAQYDADGHLILKQNPHWWGTKPYLKEMDYTIFPDANQALAAYDAGTTYDAVQVPGDAYAASAGKRDFHTAPLAAIRALTFNWQFPPFDNPDARQAFCLAINRDHWVAGALQGTALPSWHLVPQGMPGYNTGLTGVDGVLATTGDVAKARAHWAAYLATLHGAKVPPITFTYFFGRSSSPAVAQSLAQQWNAAFGAGTVTTMPLYPGGPRVKEELPWPQMTFFGWLADYPDPQDFLSLLYTSGSMYNRWHASVPAADALLARADAGGSGIDRMSLYHQAEQLLVQQVAVCPLYQYQQAYRVRSYVRNYVENAGGTLALDQWRQV